jgi:surfactin synthase thioesterase subunit
MSTINLFCLPFAGGNKYSYREYEQNTPTGLKVIPLEYPGRGARLKESLITNMEQMVDDLYIKLRPMVKGMPYAIYGHSMGGMVAFLLCKKIFADKELAAPIHLFVTGTMGPSCQYRDAINRHLLSKQDFIEEMRNLDGCPEEILQSPDLLDYFEPVLRADFEASETYTYRPAAPLTIPLTVITGTEENMQEDDILSWQQETTRTVDFRRMPGKHFFILKHPREIMGIISQKLLLTTKNSQQ